MTSGVGREERRLSRSRNDNKDRGDETIAFSNSKPENGETTPTIEDDKSISNGRFPTKNPEVDRHCHSYNNKTNYEEIETAYKPEESDYDDEEDPSTGSVSGISVSDSEDGALPAPPPPTTSTAPFSQPNERRAAAASRKLVSDVLKREELGDYIDLAASSGARKKSHGMRTRRKRALTDMSLPLLSTSTGPLLKIERSAVAVMAAAAADGVKASRQSLTGLVFGDTAETRKSGGGNAIMNRKDADRAEVTTLTTPVVFPASDQFTSLNDICRVCGSFGKGSDCRLLTCTQCGHCYHPFCADVKVSAAILTRGWRCLDCTVCENCGRNVDESKLLLCDVCDTSYHIYCLTPALDRVPPGGWRCSACVVCATCGTRESRDWERNYTECGACASCVTCPVCHVDYAENELVLRCDSCRRWLHAACDGYESERDVDAASANGYRCASCRPRAKHVNRPAPALGLAEQLRESAFGLYAILRDRRAADRGAATSCRELETLLKTKAKRTKNDEDDLQRVLTYVSHVTTSNGSDIKSPNIHAIARILSKLWRSNIRSRSVSPTRQSPVTRFRRHSIASCSDVRPPTTVAWAELVPSSENRRRRHADLSTTCATGLRNLYEKALSKDSGVSSSDGRVFRWASTALEKLEKSVIKLPPPPPPPKPPATLTPAAKRKKKSKTPSTTPTATTKINNSSISSNNVPAPLYDKNWEADEARGDGAHQAPVLFANMTRPDLRKDYPEWSARVRAIMRVWRASDSKEREVYVNMARKNRSSKTSTKIVATATTATETPVTTTTISTPVPSSPAPAAFRPYHRPQVPSKFSPSYNFPSNQTRPFVPPSPSLIGGSAMDSFAQWNQLHMPRLVDNSTKTTQATPGSIITPWRDDNAVTRKRKLDEPPLNNHYFNLFSPPPPPPPPPSPSNRISLLEPTLMNRRGMDMIARRYFLPPQLDGRVSSPRLVTGEDYYGCGQWNEITGLPRPPPISDFAPARFQPPPVYFNNVLPSSSSRDAVVMTTTATTTNSTAFSISRLLASDGNRTEAKRFKTDENPPGGNDRLIRSGADPSPMETPVDEAKGGVLAKKSTPSGPVKWKRWRPFMKDLVGKITAPESRPETEDSVEVLWAKWHVLSPPDGVRDERRCLLCGERGDGDPDAESRLLNVKINEWIHLNCALWSREVYETVGGLLKNTASALKRAKHKICHACGKDGASLACSNRKPRVCDKPLHFPCAIKSKCFLFKDKAVYCGSHKNPWPKDLLDNFRVERPVFAERSKSAQQQIEDVVVGERTDILFRIGSIVYHSLGRISTRMQKFYTENCVYPIGFRTTRFYWSRNDPRRRCYYRCSIADNRGEPEFKIDEIDDDSTTTWTSDTPQGAWNPILDAIKQTRLRHNLLQLYSNHMNGETLFGLAEPSVVKLIEAMPGIDQLHGYVYRLPRRSLLPLSLPFNPSGCVRAEASLRRGVATSGKTATRLRTLRSSSKAINVSPLVSVDLSPAGTENQTRHSPYNKCMFFTKAQQYRRLKQEWPTNVVLGRSLIQGLGLFSKRDIEKHTMVIEYKGLIIRNEVANRREKIYDDQRRGCYMFRIDSEQVIDATMHGGLARYINHSCDPNCVAEVVQIDKEKKIIIISKRFIKKGEELTYDYKFEFETEGSKISCNCGASCCRKWMN